MKKVKVVSPMRLLAFAKQHFLLPTKDLRWSIEHGRCFINERVERFSSTYLHKNDEVLFWPAKRPVFMREEECVLYEDEEILIYNKPPYITSIDLAKLLHVHLVHRLDRDTTGAILFAKKNPSVYEELFRTRKVRKTYHALVGGILQKKQGSFAANMRKIGERKGAVLWGISAQGIWSKTEWECERQGKNTALIRCQPLTGRTHQIRVHMKAIGHPILGDCEYGDRVGYPGLFRPLLHATELSFESLCIKAPFPKDLLSILGKMR